jgi:hypothetical protein
MSNVLFNKNMLDMIASVPVGASKAIQREAVEAAMAESSPGVAKATNEVNEAIIERLQEDSERYRAAVDRGVNLFISDAVSRITDYPMAQSFIEHCTENWFRALLMSEEAKCKLAEALITACYPYVKRSVPSLWKSLTLRDSEAMDRVRFTIEDALG